MCNLHVFRSVFSVWKSCMTIYNYIRAKVTGIGEKVGTVFQSHEKSDNERTRMPILYPLT